MERCLSGLKGHPAKVLAAQAAPGFESLPLRHSTHFELLFEIRSWSSFVPLTPTIFEMRRVSRVSIANREALFFMQNWYFYIARCYDSSLYIGITSNTDKRIKRHNQGLGSEWIKQHGKAKIVYTEVYNNYLEASRRELQVKKWSRKKKENLIKGIKP